MYLLQHIEIEVLHDEFWFPLHYEIGLNHNNNKEVQPEGRMNTRREVQSLTKSFISVKNTASVCCVIQ